MQIGAQLYTVRLFTQTEKDLDRTLQKIAAMGYSSVQLSGQAAGISAQSMHAMCERYGLTVGLTHTNPVRILEDTDAVIAEHKLLGCRYIGIGIMPEKYRDPAWMPYFVEDYKEAAKKIAAAGCRLMYHTHNIEFENRGGRRPIDLLCEGFMPEELGFTLDTYWLQAAGCDVLGWLDRLQDRIPCVHFKDMNCRGFTTVMAPVGEGNLDFASIVKKLDSLGKTEFAFVEQDTCEENPFVCLEKSLRNLKKFGC